MFSLAYKCFSIINDNKGVEWVEGGAVGDLAAVVYSGEDSATHKIVP